MNYTNLFKDIDRKRDLWDQRSYFWMWGETGVTLRDLDELEECLTRFAAGSRELEREPGEKVRMLLHTVGLEGWKVSEVIQ